jgi:hypothetical protein
VDPFPNNIQQFVTTQPDSRRRALLILLASLPAGCVTPVREPKVQHEPDPARTPLVRLPQVGQEWVYTVRNVYNQEVLGTITERVVSLGDQILIRRVGDKVGLLPDEIQGPWGMIVQDSHWQPPQHYSKAIPLWPLELKSGWSGNFETRYQVVGQPGFDYFWSQSMTASDWEEITTPAGTFRALKFSNIISYQNVDFEHRVSSEREETLWFVPEIGRWAIRRSTGDYTDRGRGGIFREDYLEWTLQSWK